MASEVVDTDMMPVLHLVLFKLTGRDNSTVEQVIRSFEHIETVDIPGMLTFDVGPNIVESPYAYDVGVAAIFSDAQSVEKYRVHPDHDIAVKPVEHLFEHVVTVDFPVAFESWMEP